MKCVRFTDDVVVRIDDDLAYQLVDVHSLAKYTRKETWKSYGRKTEHELLTNAIGKIGWKKKAVPKARRLPRRVRKMVKAERTLADLSRLEAGISQD